MKTVTAVHYLAAGSDAAGVTLVITLSIMGFVAYWIPSVVAIARRRDIANPIGVIIINFTLGWTVVGWIVALVMAVRSRPRPLQMMYPPPCNQLPH